MTLSADQYATLYRILRLPPGDSYSFFTPGTGNLTASLVDSWDTSSLRTTVNDRATALNSSQETDLAALLTAYEAITLGSVARINNGSIGGMSGASMTVEEKRDKIRSEVGDILGVDLRGFWEMLDRAANASQGGGRVVR